MTTKVAKLQRASLSNPVRVEVSTKYAFMNLGLDCLSNVFDYGQIPDRFYPSPILPSHAIERQGCIPCIPRQYTSSKFNHDLHSDGARCFTVWITLVIYGA